jgi:uncharacterized membrane protein (TIGR02234 family)
MKAAHHLFSLGGLGLALIAFTLRWWQGVLTTGAEFSLVGTQAEPVAWSMTLAAGASYTAALLLRGVVKRVALGLQAVLAGGAASALLMTTGFPATALERVIASSTGISGPAALEGLETIVATGSELFAMFSLSAAAIGGVLGQFGPRNSSQRDRFSRDTTTFDDSQGAWDSLSDGLDPTT